MATMSTSENKTSLHYEQSSCPFCGPQAEDRFLRQNDEAASLLDGFPVSSGHTLFIPRRHVSDYFHTTGPERACIEDLMFDRRDQLLREDDNITGFNVGINVGASSGQTVWHVHVHLIPRRDGDHPNPRGGVRGVIPSQKDYVSP